MTNEYYLPNHSNKLSLSYRGKHFDNFELAASKVVINVKMEKLEEILRGIFIIWEERQNTCGFIKYSDCKNLTSNYRDYQNLLYQIGLLDKTGHGKYIMTLEGEKIGKGEPFCKHFPIALLNTVQTKKQDDKHALLLLWFYYLVLNETGTIPQKEHFQKDGRELTAYPNIRKEVGKTVMNLLKSCLRNDIESIQDFFKKWIELNQNTGLCLNTD